MSELTILYCAFAYLLSIGGGIRNVQDGAGKWPVIAGVLIAPVWMPVALGYWLARGR